MADQELWELAVTVPPVTEEIRVLAVSCGGTTAEVRRDPNAGWRAWQAGYHVTEASVVYADAVRDAGEWVRTAERKRLLANALEDVLRNREPAVFTGSGEDGELRG